MYKLLTFILLLSSCKSPIKQENKIAIIGKILDRPRAAKNGAKSIVYYYLGNQYLKSSSFDARRFTYGDKFLIYIDKENPRKTEFPKPDIKLGNLDDIQKSPSINYYINDDDMKKLDSIE